MAPQKNVYIALGSNLGNRERYIRTALSALDKTTGVTLSRHSSIIETDPLCGSDQPKYLNTVAEIKTSLDPYKLLAALTEIENSLGRERKQKWFPRTIDLDILLCGDEIIETGDLIVPHPQMHLRSFVLTGLSELSPELIHPSLKVSVSELACRLNGQDFALNPQLPQLVSIAGMIGVGKTTLAKRLSEKIGARLLLEPYDTNPFLPNVYAGRNALSLHCQLYFLFVRTEQLSPASLTAGSMFFTDYIFQKELIYARRFLSPEQLSTYQSLYPPCAESITAPVLAVYLRDEPLKCLDRIHRRNRPYEQQIEQDFLTDLDIAYEKLFAQWTRCPVIRLSKSEFDCNRPEDIDYLISQIRAYTAFNR